tara:strand:+ start:1220 stop:2095 length:876 start_codon:yes stop_codon:yes gene_type:complete
MAAQRINGTEIAQSIRDEAKTQIQSRLANQGTRPGLDVILIGDNPASKSYVGHKERACLEVGINSTVHRLKNDVTKQELLNLIDQLNQQEHTHGILLQLPLPEHLQPQDFLEKISPEKDVDGFHPYNMGKLILREPGLRPCTPLGIMTLLKRLPLNITGLHAVIIGASNIVGRPMAMELLLAKCTVTVCHRFTSSLAAHVKQADILISATGKPNIIQSDWIKPGAIVIDVGFSKLSNGTIIGDIDFETAKLRAGWITPVPGGVGPMTVATLMHNTVQAANTQSPCPTIIND